MRIDFVTLFPEVLGPYLGSGILGRARRAGRVDIGYANPRDFVRTRHRKVDDRPYGGGAGMILMAEPLYAALKSLKPAGARVVLLSPQGRRLDQAAARRLSREKRLIFVCGRYEGLDERVMGLFDEELSLGDFVLSGGELPALAAADAVIRLLPGVLKKEDAARAESFTAGMLDYPQYTRPRVWRGKRVPAALLSGDHGRIERWRHKAARAATQKKRPDLLRSGRAVGSRAMN